jgi:DNA-binding NtrC family response regulator
MASVVLIENDAPIVRLLGWFLVDAGHAVVAIDNVMAATEHVRTELPDVVVFNSSLPASAKLPFVSEWRQIHPRLGVVDVSRRSATLERAPYTGADAYLQMPFDADHLLSAISDVLDRRR